MNGGDYEGAVFSFQALLALRTQGDLARQAALYLGQSYYTLGKVPPPRRCGLRGSGGALSCLTRTATKRPTWLGTITTCSGTTSGHPGHIREYF